MSGDDGIENGDDDAEEKEEEREGIRSGIGSSKVWVSDGKEAPSVFWVAGPGRGSFRRLYPNPEGCMSSDADLTDPTVRRIG